MAEGEGKRTTVVFGSEDLENLQAITTLLDLPSDSEGVRRSLRICRILLEFQKIHDGKVMLIDAEGKEERVWFL